MEAWASKTLPLRIYSFGELAIGASCMKLNN